MKNLDGCGFVPVLTTQAGSCLTADNWREAGIQVVSCYLSSLLLKPGYEFLMRLPDLASYMGWPETLVLNASLPKRCVDGLYKFRSSYDGNRMQYSAQEIMVLIAHLQPDIVILPSGLTQEDKELFQLLPDTIFPFFPETDFSYTANWDRPYGISLSYDEKGAAISELFKQIESFQGIPRYVAGDLSLTTMRELIKSGVQFIESDLPAKDACMGRVYGPEGDLFLPDNTYTMQFSMIDTNCKCPTCTQQFTRAYLHHLFDQTPLLCQRFLIQHNIYSAPSFTPGRNIDIMSRSIKQGRRK